MKVTDADTVFQDKYSICTLCTYYSMTILELSGHSTKDCFGPDSTRSFVWSIGRIFAKIVGNLRALTSTTIYIRGKIWPPRQSPTICRSLFSTPVQDEPECTFNALIGLKDRTDPLQTEEETRRVRDNAVRTEKSEEKEKQHTLEIVNAVVASQQEIVKALRENGRELRAVLGAVQTLANEQKSMRQCFESFKRELTGLPCKRKLEDNSGSRSKENKRPEKRGDRRDR